MRSITWLFTFLALASLKINAQDLTGIWRGHFNQMDYQRDAEGNKVAIPVDRYKFEVQLDHRDKNLMGVTYSYLTTVFYGKATASGTVNPKTKKVLLEELKIVEVRMSSFSDACIMTCFLQYTRSGDEEFLEGTYTSMNVRDSSNCGRGTVFLRKVPSSDFYKEPFLAKRESEKSEKKPEKKSTDSSRVKTNNSVTKPLVTKANPPKTSTSGSVKKPNKNTVAKNIPVKKPPAKRANTNSTSTTRQPKETIVKTPAIDTTKKAENKSPVIASRIIIPKVLINRSNEVVKTIVTSANEIEIKIYDNGTIDNDTVSVYLDKKLVVSKQRLTEKAIRFTFKLDDTNDFHELVMVAENLGEIPPNTSLMIVNAAGKQYEVRITSNEQKNAVVIFKYEKSQ